MRAGNGDAQGGLHLGVVGGPTLVTFSAGDDAVLDTAGGLAGGGFAGYDAWIADQWALGGFLRVMAANTTDDSSEDFTLRLAPITVTLGVSAVYQ